jgi:hypothetical protein
MSLHPAWHRHVRFVRQPIAEAASLISASSPLSIKLVEHARSCAAASSFRFAHRVNWAFVPNQLQFVAAARAFKIAKLIARHYWFGDAAQHFDVALRTGWPVVDVRAPPMAQCLLYFASQAAAIYFRALEKPYGGNRYSSLTATMVAQQATDVETTQGLKAPVT